MVYEGELFCPVCGGALKLYDHVMRMIKIQKGVKTYIYIRRLRCTKCGRVHRELPEHIIPHIHYDKAIVNGVLNGWISPDDLEYEDYPCEMTMIRWKERDKKGFKN